MLFLCCLATRVSVMDADGPVAIKNDLIGSYSFDAANVYFHKVRLFLASKQAICNRLTELGVQ